eukprot:COSAG04_NODE_6274_length_1367_cov_1.478707_4_plen_108_part_01
MRGDGRPRRLLRCQSRALLRCDSLPLTVLRLGAGITAATLVNTSCAAYHTTDSGENRSRCCLYTQADINDPTRGRLTQDPSGTLHVQVGANRTVDTWRCPTSIPAGGS